LKSIFLFSFEEPVLCHFISIIHYVLFLSALFSDPDAITYLITRNQNSSFTGMHNLLQHRRSKIPPTSVRVSTQRPAACQVVRFFQ